MSKTLFVEQAKSLVDNGEIDVNRYPNPTKYSIQEGFLPVGIIRWK